MNYILYIVAYLIAGYLVVRLTSNISPRYKRSFSLHNESVNLHILLWPMIPCVAVMVYLFLGLMFIEKSLKKSLGIETVKDYDRYYER